MCCRMFGDQLLLVLPDLADQVHRAAGLAELALTEQKQFW